MNVIKLLAPDQAQKIAAGEVIERPANIVKELIENSIDAQATQISLYIEKSGKQLIRIVDNGCGMSTHDARMCFLPHATSKITSIQELESISSFGFRGEGLASISAISKVTLITKQHGASSGILLQYAEGNIVEEKEVACNVGTDLSAADLFYNIPVRKKFLKQDETEWNQIQSLFYAFCISNQMISFKLFHDDKLILNAPPANNLKDRITQIWDFNFTQQLLPLEQPILNHNWLSITGYISNHHFWRHGKHNVFFFVNNRWIKNPELSKAIFKGYYNVLPPGKFPAAFITITIDKNLVDINCHPKKEEVRFVKPATVEVALTTLIKQTLEQSISHKIMPTENPHPSIHFAPPNFAKHSGRADFLETNYAQEIVQELQAPLALPSILPQPAYDNFDQPFDSPGDSMKHQTEPYIDKPIRSSRVPAEGGCIEGCGLPGSIVGQLFNTYIVIDNDQELVLIDQHAAHERILYEKFLKNFEQKEGTQLLFPEIIRLSKEHLELLIPEKAFFAQQGLELEQISSNEIIIKTAPPQLQNTSLKDFILDAATFIEEHERLDREEFRKKLNEHVHSHMACKAAIKAGDALTMEQMQKLMQTLYKTEKRFICIHGRPTMWSIDKLEIEKHFRRK